MMDTIDLVVMAAGLVFCIWLAWKSIKENQ